MEGQLCLPSTFYIDETSRRPFPWLSWYPVSHILPHWIHGTGISTKIYHENQGFMWVNKGTPPKTNMDTQNDGLESRYFPLKLAIFGINSLDFWSVNIVNSPMGILWESHEPPTLTAFSTKDWKRFWSRTAKKSENIRPTMSNTTSDDWVGLKVSEKERSVL